MKFIHVADTHLGCEVPVTYREIRKRDFLEAFKKVVDFAVKENVDFIIHSGDFLDDYFRISSRYILDILDILFKLKEKGIPFIFIKGNHDNKGQKQNTVEILKKLGLIIEANEREPIVIKDFYIYGISEPSNLSGDELKFIYEKILKEMKVDKTGYSILLFHGVSNVVPEGLLEKYSKEPRIIGQDKFPDVDFYAFGHFHNSFITKIDEKIFSLPGSTERTEISPIEEKFEKGFFYFEDSNYKFIPTGARKVSIIEKHIEKEGDINELYEEVYKKSKESLIKVRVRYRRDLYDSIRRSIDSLISSGYLIIDEYYPSDIEEEIVIKEDNLIFEDVLSQLLVSDEDKKSIMEILQKLKYFYEEYSDEEGRNIERIRDLMFKELV
ncbi:DNA repair exonuclease [Nanoarchaeota archaeon NZ13-N]|nr:MAG: DNA repair exonuclease [Nanoarchaeota archaeon NZ13-N]